MLSTHAAFIPECGTVVKMVHRRDEHLLQEQRAQAEPFVQNQRQAPPAAEMPPRSNRQMWWDDGGYQRDRRASLESTLGARNNALLTILSVPPILPPPAKPQLPADDLPN